MTALLSLAALAAKARHFQSHVARGEAAAAGAGGDRVGKTRAVQFVGIAALGADQKEAAVTLSRMGAADEGIHALDAVDQAVLDQEVECAIDGGRRRAEILVAQLVEQRVGADRLVARQTSSSTRRRSGVKRSPLAAHSLSAAASASSMQCS